MKKGAQFSEDRKYRYALWRTWDEGSGHVMFIGLNPSTADEFNDDPTIKRCVNFAKKWGFGGIYMLNLFAYRTTDPKYLMENNYFPIGPENNDYLRMYFNPSGLNIACWGNRGLFLNRGQRVIELLGIKNLSCLGMTKKNQPKHPLYLKNDIEPISMSLFERVKQNEKSINTNS